MSGMIDRLMRSSVDRALKMQPRRTQRVADELLYAAPSAREDVGAVREAGERLVRAGFCPAGLGAIAVRRTPKRAAITAIGADLSALDNRHLESVDLDDRVSPALAALRSGAEAAVYAFPPTLLALVSEGVELFVGVSDLADVAGPVAIVDSVDAIRSGVTVVAGRGVVSGHEDPLAAVARLEAAEALAIITLTRLSIRRTAE